MFSMKSIVLLTSSMAFVSSRIMNAGESGPPASLYLDVIPCSYVISKAALISSSDIPSLFKASRRFCLVSFSLKALIISSTARNGLLISLRSTSDVYSSSRYTISGGALYSSPRYSPLLL